MPYWQAHKVQTGLLVLLAIGALSVVAALATGMAQPDFSVWGKLPLKIQIHASAAILAFFMGAAQLLLPKRGRKLHMVMGVIWVVAMLVTAISALFIRQLLHGWFSPIHLFVLLTAWSLWRGIGYLSRRKFRSHGQEMRNLYFGALIVAGMFTFMPGRVMYEMILGG